MSRIFVPLAKEPFAKFAFGSKTVEVRNAGSPVAAQVRKAEPGAAVLLRRGYSGTWEAHGSLGRVWEGPADEMPEWAKTGAALTPESWDGRFFDPGGRVLCFEVTDLPRNTMESADRRRSA